MNRIYRLYDVNAGKFLRWRYYSIARNAHMNALIEARWAKIGISIDVVNHENGKSLCRYIRKVDSVGIRSFG